MYLLLSLFVSHYTYFSASDCISRSSYRRCGPTAPGAPTATGGYSKASTGYLARGKLQLCLWDRERDLRFWAGLAATCRTQGRTCGCRPGSVSVHRPRWHPDRRVILRRRKRIPSAGCPLAGCPTCTWADPESHRLRFGSPTTGACWPSINNLWFLAFLFSDKAHTSRAIKYKCSIGLPLYK